MIKTRDEENKEFKSIAPVCKYCGTKTYLTSFKYLKFRDKKKHAHKNRLIYRCPKCNRYVNVHKGTNKPLGFPGDKELRLWRKFTHMIFDEVWKKNGNRKKTYTWLARNLGIDIEECHIGMFTSEECELTIEMSIKELCRLPV